MSDENKAVWARGEIWTTRCPKSIITAQSAYYLEQFVTWKEAGMGSLLHYDAKIADAILLLESFWRAEKEGVDEED